ncbi:hypothetical protein ONZ43_g2470 [Nemania bipapillata]|uniref:Uncharacterized protein n=1 Tax=Nemania bipapillata TaxID=110536 RepID=A0ACC2J0P8_9PEZI|nr:hypothetical protein ONZ43_g2470 [Nemania bipapillata]
MALDRDSFNRQSLGPSLNASVKQAQVLMVGAGGIGCELLKNLVLSGFGEIHIVDLDTIDLSNLNRQFLFRYEHIKKPKAEIAKEAAQRFNPNVNIVAYHANIKDAQFNLEWFKTFRLVFNALDNLEARRHVNRMCLAADVPLIESGTTGFNGQVQVIKKGVTACYDCTAKEIPKSFPVCTIRSTPSQPIHCIVWGKGYLLNEIFGASEDQAVLDTSENSDNAKEIAELKKESEALRKIRESVGTDQFPQLLFDKVFNKDIMRLLTMEEMWKSRRPPEPLQYDLVLRQAMEASASKEAIIQDGQKVWTLEENLVVFNDSLTRLSKRMLDLKKQHGDDSPQATISFDKDDEDTLDFVAASANIRSHVFGIERKSRFDIKQMADLSRATLNDLVEDFVKLQLGFGERDFAVNSDAGLLYDPDETDNLGKLLSELGINQNSFVTIVDEEEEDTFINVVLNIQSSSAESTGKPIKGLEPDKALEIPRKPKKEPIVEFNGDRSLTRQREPDLETPPNDLKRPREDDSDMLVVRKKKTKIATDDGVVVIEGDDPSNGVITIDDD